LPEKERYSLFRKKNEEVGALVETFFARQKGKEFDTENERSEGGGKGKKE